MTYWIKMIGTKEHNWPADRPYDLPYIGFRGRKPVGIKDGDLLALYAVGHKRVFGLVQAEGTAYDSTEGNVEGWPYRINIQPLHVGLAPKDAVDAHDVLDDLRRVCRQSHISISTEEFKSARDKLEGR